MARLNRTIRASILSGGAAFLLALPVAAQGKPPPADPPKGQKSEDVAPADVKLEEEGKAEADADAEKAAPAPEPAEAAEPAAEAQGEAQAEAGATVEVSGQADANAAGEEEEAVVIEEANLPSRTGVEVGMGDWEFGYHGFFRAPMRVGIGKRDVEPASSGDFSETTLHLPLVPDDQHLSWQRTNHSHTDWAELFFSVGNPYARGVVAIEGYNFTQASYSMPETQFGVSQGFVEIMPELPYENVRIRWRVGTFWANYGKAGRWDAGEYDTYLFGRTKGAGELFRAEIDLSGITLALEDGVGAKRPDASQYNPAKFTMLHHIHGFLEYGGLMVGLHHLYTWSQEEDREGVGMLNTENPNGAVYNGYTSDYSTYAPGATGALGMPDGHFSVMGAEVKFDAGPYGLAFLGYARMSAKDAMTVSNAVEWMHADGGGRFNLGIVNNYLDNPRCDPVGMVGPGRVGCSSGGTGDVDAVLFQYEFSVANLLQGLRDGTTYWGEGMDFKTLIYAMYDHVSSSYRADYDPLAELDANGNPIDNYSDHNKLKFGADLQFNAFPVGGVALRFDRLQPNDNLPEQSFSILSPRLFLRSQWITRETITLQYSRYFYDQRTCDTVDDYDFTGYNPNATGLPVNQRCVQYPSAPRPPEGWGAQSMNLDTPERGNPVAGGNPNNVRPDVNVITVAAQMWW